MIGAKTVTAIFLFATSLVIAIALDLFRVERLLSLDVSTAFWIGGFAALVGSLIFHFVRLDTRSAHYLRYSTESSTWEGEAHFLGSERRRITIGKNQGDAFDFSPAVQLGICVSMALLLGLGTIDSRSLDLVQNLPERMRSRSQYCPSVEEEVAVADPSAPGCALVRRAYQLGYAKSLGACGTTKRGEADRICTLRQYDEPLLHYAFRLLVSFYDKMRGLTEAGYATRMKRDFEQRTERLGALFGAQRSIIATLPRASHHIWTNLPDPDDGAFDADTCIDRYRTIPHRPPASDDAHRPSIVFEHVVSQLLFEARYEPSAGFCREYLVHWNADPDVCAKLVNAPQQFLSQSGDLGHVQRVLERYQVGQEMTRMQADLQETSTGVDRAARPKLRQMPPPKFISFSCYIEEPRADAQRTTRQFWLLGHDFTAEELRVPPAAAGTSDLFTDRYGQVAALLVHGFHYGGLMSQSGIESDDVENALSQSFAGRDFLLSRLDTLTGLDIFLQSHWIAQRDDLLQVYPYHLHLQNYVNVFRRQYQRERGRL